MANKKKNPERPSKRYPTDLFIDQAERIDQLVEDRNKMGEKVWSRAQVIKEFVEDGLTKEGY